MDARRERTVAARLENEETNTRQAGEKVIVVTTCWSPFSHAVLSYDYLRDGLSATRQKV
jgi:hypothetical protein